MVVELPRGSLLRRPVCRRAGDVADGGDPEGTAAVLEIVGGDLDGKLRAVFAPVEAQGHVGVPRLAGPRGGLGFGGEVAGAEGEQFVARVAVQAFCPAARVHNAVARQLHDEYGVSLKLKELSVAFLAASQGLGRTPTVGHVPEEPLDDAPTAGYRDRTLTISTGTRRPSTISTTNSWCWCCGRHLLEGCAAPGYPAGKSRYWLPMSFRAGQRVRATLTS